jgi:hypothetical protein
MRLPSGEVLRQAVNLKKIDFIQTLKDLSSKGFSGYVILLIEGFNGLEEGVLVFKNGEINASFYEYLKFGVTVFGDYALPQVFNASVADFGVMDVISLSGAQVDLITAFQEKSIVRKRIKIDELKKFAGKKFNNVYAKKILEKVLKKTEKSTDLFKKFGLTELKG